MISFNKAPCEEGLVHHATPGCAERAKPWVLTATILGSSMAFIDGSVVNVALPAIQADLATSIAGAQWIVNAYLLMLGALVLLGGSAGDRFGRRRMFIVGIIIFTLASATCGLATNTPMLIIARAIQGIGSALLVPGSLAIISASFSEAERGRAIGTWAGFSAITTALGPVLGGWIIDAWSWRIIFFINVPLALVTLGIALRYVSESRNERDRTQLDWLGAVLAAIGLGSVVYGLIAASDYGWIHPTVLGTLGAGALILAVFLWAESRAVSPMMPLTLFRSPRFSGANGMTLLLYAALSGALFFLPFYLIDVLSYSAAAAGAAFLPFTVIMGALSRWSGGLLKRYGARIPLTIGPIVAAAGFALFAILGGEGSYWMTFFPAMVVLGLGMAVSVAPLTTTVMDSVVQSRAGTASGINNAVSRIAGMLAVAVFGAVAVGVFGTALDARMGEMQVSPEVRHILNAQVPKLAEAKVPPQVEEVERQALQQAINKSFAWSFRVIMWFAAGLALLSAVCAALTMGGKKTE
jgi:EmrB/QacA subfamily drug resistance transporter